MPPQTAVLEKLQGLSFTWLEYSVSPPFIVMKLNASPFFISANKSTHAFLFSFQEEVISLPAFWPVRTKCTGKQAPATYLPLISLLKFNLADNHVVH